MPFIVPFLPLIAKAGAAIGGSVVAGKLAGKQSKTEKQLQSEQLKLNQQQQANAQEALGRGRTFLDSSTMDLGKLKTFWQDILTDRTKAFRYLAPYLGQRSQRQGALGDSLVNLNPRAAGLGETLAKRGFQDLGEIEQGFMGLQSMAPDRLAAFAGEDRAAGLNLFGQGTGATSNAFNQLALLQQQEQQRKQQAGQTGFNIGGLLFDFLQNFNLGKKTGTGGSAGGGSGDPRFGIA